MSWPIEFFASNDVKITENIDIIKNAIIVEQSLNLWYHWEQIRKFSWWSRLCCIRWGRKWYKVEGKENNDLENIPENEVLKKNKINTDLKPT